MQDGTAGVWAENRDDGLLATFAPVYAYAERAIGLCGMAAHSEVAYGLGFAHFEGEPFLDGIGEEGILGMLDAGE
jgi:hypothetical protein